MTTCHHPDCRRPTVRGPWCLPHGIRADLGLPIGPGNLGLPGCTEPVIPDDPDDLDDDRCAVGDCGKPGPFRLGLCPMHYQRLRRNGDTDGLRPHGAPAALCAAACGRPAHARGLCNSHYRRWLRGNRSAAPLRPYQQDPDMTLLTTTTGVVDTDDADQVAAARQALEARTVRDDADDDTITAAARRELDELAAA